MNHKFDTDAENIEKTLSELRPRALDNATLSRLKGREHEHKTPTRNHELFFHWLRNPWAWSAILMLALAVIGKIYTPEKEPTNNGIVSQANIIATLQNIESNRILEKQTPIIILPGPSDTQIQLMRYHWVDYKRGKSEDGREFYWPEFSSEIKPVLLNAL